MRSENIVSGPVKATYKYGVYSALAFSGMFLAGFIVWSFLGLGTAVLALL